MGTDIGLSGGIRLRGRITGILSRKLSCRIWASINSHDGVRLCVEASFGPGRGYLSCVGTIIVAPDGVSIRGHIASDMYRGGSPRVGAEIVGDNLVRLRGIAAVALGSDCSWRVETCI